MVRQQVGLLMTLRLTGRGQGNTSWPTGFSAGLGEVVAVVHRVKARGWSRKRRDGRPHGMLLGTHRRGCLETWRLPMAVVRVLTSSCQSARNTFPLPPALGTCLCD